MPALRDVFVSTPGGADVPLGQLASFQTTEGPPMIKSEQTRPIATVFVDLQDGVDIGTFIQNAKERVREEVDLPAGYSLTWSGQYEYMERANERLQVLVPLRSPLSFCCSSCISRAPTSRCCCWGSSRSVS